MDSEQRTDAASLEAEREHLFLAMLRWIAVVPAAIAGALVGGTLAYLISFLGSALAGFDLVANDPRHFVLAAGFSSFAAVYCASWIAPARRQGLVAVGIAILEILIAIFALVVNLAELSWVPILQNVAVIVGAVLGAEYVRDNRPL